MSFLLWLQNNRTPFLTEAFSVVTRFGSEAICLGLICLLFWCIDKKTAYKLGFSFYFSALAVQSLKITFRIERPWVLNPQIKPVQFAIADATGYSFPSGHTQIATSVYSTGFWSLKNIFLKILCGAVICAVAVSRMYLGVHTPLDVGVSFLISIAVAYIVFVNFEKLYSLKNVKKLSLVFATMSLAVAIYAFLMYNLKLVPFAEARDCCKAAGAGIGFALGYYLERKYINYNEKYGTTGFQIIKLALGIIVLFAIRAFLKSVFPAQLIFDIIRYFVIALFALALYPYLINKYIQKAHTADKL